MRFVGLLLLIAGLACAGTAQAADDDGSRQTHQAQTLNPVVARALTDAYEKLENDHDKAALAALNKLVNGRGDSMKPFDLASVLQIRGTALVRQNRYDAALRDFERVLDIGALPAEQNQQIRFNVAQLNFQAQHYDAAIRYLKDWIASTEAPGANAYYMLAAAYYYKKQYRSARPNAERALRAAESANKRYYELANIIDAKLGANAARAKLLERMIGHWPDEVSYWKQLAALYKQLGQTRKSLATLELAYNNGLINAADDIKSLAQLYSVQDNPHRGAKLVANEMDAGRIKRNVDNLQLLSQLWSQAREHDKAIPVLRAAAKRSDTGTLSYRLGQTLLADEDNPAAERALEAALRKGGLDSSDRADAWLLLGTARFNQAGPGDKDKRTQADRAFAKAQQFSATRKRAGGWRRYIAAINDTERRQNALEARQSQKLEAAAEQRRLTSCRAQKLAGKTLSDQCRALMQRLEQDNGQDSSEGNKVDQDNQSASG